VAARTEIFNPLSARGQRNIPRSRDCARERHAETSRSGVSTTDSVVAEPTTERAPHRIRPQQRRPEQVVDRNVLVGDDRRLREGIE
jgi:hypothetical protein